MAGRELGGPGVLGRVAASIGRRPWIGITAWAVLVGIAGATALGGITGETLFDRLVSGAPTATSESSRADDILTSTATSASTETVTLLVHGVDLTDPAVTAVGPDLEVQLGSDTVTVVDPLAVPLAPDGTRLPAVATLFAEDGRGVLLPVTVSGVGDADPDPAEVDQVVSVLTETRDALRTEFPDATVEVGSTKLLVDSIVAVSESDLQRGESVALPIALVIMLVVFGGFIAAGVPLIGAIAAIVGALGALFGISHLMDIDTTVINVITAVGLGLSIDYGLLMVSRFREEYRTLLATGHGAEVDLRIAAITRTAETAGRTVLYSGTTFAIASLGLLVFEPRLVRAIGVGALSVTAIALASALTLIPALLGLFGARLARPGALTRLPLVGRAITRFGDVAPVEGVFSRLTRSVQRHPALITVLCVLALLALASPVLGLRLANTSVDALPASAVQKTFVTTLTNEFPDAASPRIALVTDTEADGLTWAAQVEALPRVISVGTPTEQGDGWRTTVRVLPVDGIDVVREIRADRPDFPVALVSGTDARTLDFSQSLLDRAPWAILIVAFGTILLLFLMTGSLVVPLKALVASALSLGASFGVLVWGFQWGNFAGLMGFDASEVHGVDPLVLVLVLAFGFGLAMDYEMFILSRIKEFVDAGVDGREAIALGLQRSGRIISSAGLIIVVVFAGFATGDLMVIKQLGVALAVAVVLDATLVRMLLVPAFMTWQEPIMWWAPRWMKRLHSRFALRD
jgi:RND superfamily putative drug exporter